MNIKSIVNHNVIFAAENLSVLDVVKIMDEENVGSVVIVDQNKNSKPIGMITDRDIALRGITQNENLEKTAIKELMTQDLLILNESDDLDSVIESMSDKKVRRAPVVDDNDALVGIVALDDIITTEAKLLGKIGALIEQQV